MADERKNPNSALDVGENTESSVNSINAGGINANNESTAESREEQAKRLMQQKQASFEYADNYRQKLKRDAEARKMTPAQMRKKAEKEAAIAREKAEKEAAIRQAIEKEKEEALARSQSAANLRDQVEKSLANKKAQEEAEAEAQRIAEEEALARAEEARAKAEAEAKEAAERAQREAQEKAEREAREAREKALAESLKIDEEDLSDMTFTVGDEDEEPTDELFDDGDGMSLTFDFGEESPADEETEDDDMVLTFSPDEINYIHEEEKAPAHNEEKAEEKPTEEAPEVAEEEITVEPAAEAPKEESKAPATAPKAPVAAPKKKAKKKVAPKKASKAPKKAVAMPKPAKKKAAAEPEIPEAVSVPNPFDERIAELLEENKQLLIENIDELRRRQSELEERQKALENATPMQEEASETPEDVIEVTPDVAEEVTEPEAVEITEEAPKDEKTVDIVVAPAKKVILENGRAASNVERPEPKGIVEEIPDSSYIVNYIGDEEIPEDLTSAAAVYGLTALTAASLKKKITDNDRLARKLRKKLRNEKKDYRTAKSKEEKLECLADMAEYQRNILDFNTESLAAQVLLGKNYENRKKSLKSDVNKYNAFAQKLENKSTTQIQQAPATLPDDVIAGRPYKKLPPVTTANLADNDSSIATNNDKNNPLSYVSQLDNDDRSITGISGRPAAAKGRKGALAKGKKRGNYTISEAVNGAVEESTDQALASVAAVTALGAKTIQEAQGSARVIGGASKAAADEASVTAAPVTAVGAKTIQEAESSAKVISTTAVTAKNASKLAKKTGKIVESKKADAEASAPVAEERTVNEEKVEEKYTALSSVDGTAEEAKKAAEPVEQGVLGNYIPLEAMAKEEKAEGKATRLEAIEKSANAVDSGTLGTLTPANPEGDKVEKTVKKTVKEDRDGTKVISATEGTEKQTKAYISAAKLAKQNKKLEGQAKKNVPKAQDNKTADAAKASAKLEGENKKASKVADKKVADKKASKGHFTVNESQDSTKVLEGMRLRPEASTTAKEPVAIATPIGVKKVLEVKDSAKVIAVAPVIDTATESVNTFDVAPTYESAPLAPKSVAEPYVRPTPVNIVISPSKTGKGYDVSEKVPTNETQIKQTSVYINPIIIGNTAPYDASAIVTTNENGGKVYALDADDGKKKSRKGKKGAREDASLERRTVAEGKDVKTVKAEVPVIPTFNYDKVPMPDREIQVVQKKVVSEEPSSVKVIKANVPGQKSDDEGFEFIVPITVAKAADDTAEQDEAKEVMAERDFEPVVFRTSGESANESEKNLRKKTAEAREEATEATAEAREEAAEAQEKEQVSEPKAEASENENASLSIDELLGKSEDESAQVNSRETEEAEEATETVAEGTLKEATEEATETKAEETAETEKVEEKVEETAETEKVEEKTEEATEAKAEEAPEVEVFETKAEEAPEAEEITVTEPEKAEEKVEETTETKAEEAPKAEAEEVVEAKAEEKAEETAETKAEEAPEAEAEEVAETKAEEKAEEVVELSSIEPETESEKAEEAPEAKADEEIGTLKTLEEIEREAAEEAKPEEATEAEEVKAEAKPEEATEAEKAEEATEAKTEETAEKKENAPKTVKEIPSSAKVLLGKFASKVSDDTEKTKVIAGKKADEEARKTVSEVAESTRVLAGESTENRVVLESLDDTKVLEGRETEQKTVSEVAESTKVLEGKEVEQKTVLESLDDTKVLEGREQEKKTLAADENATKVISGSESAKKQTNGYILTENSEKTKKFEATRNGYTLTEEPDSAKRFEATEQKQTTKGKFTITESPDASKTIEGRPELKYTVTQNESGKRVVKAEIADEGKNQDYRILEDRGEIRVLNLGATAKTVSEVAESTRVLAGESTENRVVLESLEGTKVLAGKEVEQMTVSEVKIASDESTLVSEAATEEKAVETEQATEAEEAVNYAVLTSDMPAEETESEDIAKDRKAKRADFELETITALHSDENVLKEHEASAKVIRGNTAESKTDAKKTVIVNADATKVISGKTAAELKGKKYTIVEDFNRGSDADLNDDVRDVLSAEGETVEVADTEKSYEYKLDDLDIEVPEEYREALAEEQSDEKTADEKKEIADDELRDIVEGRAFDLANENVKVLADKKNYVLTEESRPQEETAQEQKLETLVTSRYTIKEELPESKAEAEAEELPESEAESDGLYVIDNVEAVAEPSESGVYVIKQYEAYKPKDEKAEEKEADAQNASEKEREEIIIYGKKTDSAQAVADETVYETKELEARKAKGRYVLTESVEVKAEEVTEAEEVAEAAEAAAEAEEAVQYAILSSDEPAKEAATEEPTAKTKKSKRHEPELETITVSDMGEKKVREQGDSARVIPGKENAQVSDKTLIFDDESIKVIAGGNASEKQTKGYILTENSAETKKFEATSKGYTLTEEPDSAKRFEATEVKEISSGKFVITVSQEDAKTIEGRPELKYTVTQDESGRKSVKAEIADENKASEYKIVEDKNGVRVLSGTKDVEYKLEKPRHDLPDAILANPVPEHMGVAEEENSAKVIPSIKIINAPKSRDAYVILEENEQKKTIPSAESIERKVAEGEVKTVSGTEKAERKVAEGEGKTVSASEAKASGYEIAENLDGVDTIPADKFADRVVREEENPKAILRDNKVLNTKKSQNNYALLESRESKVVPAASAISESEVKKSTSNLYTIGEGVSKTVEGDEAAATIKQTYRLSTEEEHRKILEAIEILKRANYDVSEIERKEKAIQAAKILNTDSDDNAYTIIESRDVKVIAANDGDGATYYAVAEDFSGEKVIEKAPESAAYEISEEEQPKATEAKILNARKSKDNYVLIENRGSEKVIAEAAREEAEEKLPERKAKAKSTDNYAVTEGRDSKTVAKSKSSMSDADYELFEKWRSCINENTIYIPKGARIVNASKSGDRYFIAESKSPLEIVRERISVPANIGVYENASGTKAVKARDERPDRSQYKVFEKSNSAYTVYPYDKTTAAKKGDFLINEKLGSELVIGAGESLRSGESYRIGESANAYTVKAHNNANVAGATVYESANRKVISGRENPYTVKDTAVYEQVGSAKIISNKDYKLPAKPLIYDEYGTQKIIRPEQAYNSNSLANSIVEYKGTEALIRGNIPVVDVFIDPYKDVNMGVLSIGDLKKYLGRNDLEIAKLKYDLKTAKKKKLDSNKNADKVISHIAMVNYQCLICERYVERIVVCNNSGNKYYAEKGAASLRDELNKYNDFVNEYNLMTSSKIPFASKSLPKRVLAGEAYEHLSRISYKLINEQAPMKTSKKFNKKHENKPAAKIIEEKRYLADIKLLNRCDDESEKDMLLVGNRYAFETALLKSEKDMMSYKFAKRSKKNAIRKAFIGRKLRALKKAKTKAQRFEALDNERYYRVLMCDTNLESYKNNVSKKKKVSKIVGEVSKLLKERDLINAKLNAVYAGPLADISGAGTNDKWRQVKSASAKKHSRKLRGKAIKLKNSVPGFGEKKAERVHMFHSLLDAKVEAQSTIDLCKYRLKKEKNSFKDKRGIRKDMAAQRKRIRLIDREIKERRKLIREEYYGPDASFELTILVGFCLVGLIAAAYLAQHMGIDIGGIISPYVQNIKASVPVIQQVVDILKANFSIEAIKSMYENLANSPVVEALKKLLEIVKKFLP